MTTKQSGERITGLLALTVEAQEALDVGDPVQLIAGADREVEAADGTGWVLGHVSVSNKMRVSNVMGTSVGNPRVPGDITVEARGFEVRVVTVPDNVAIDAGNGIVVAATGYRAYDAVGGDTPDMIVGRALTSLPGTGPGTGTADFDMLTV